MLGIVRRNGRRRETRGNLERGGHAEARIMPAFETLPRILSSAKTFPYFVKMLVLSLYMFA